MSDYKRFVSYIYGYDQGEKGENTGFVKVNARGGECRIWVHVKGFYSQRQKPYRVYVFKQKRERLEGQYLGELESRNGALEWNGVTQTDSLMGGFGLDESRGIYIEGENRVFAAEWDDYPVDVDRFRPLERSARQEEAENGARRARVPVGRRGGRPLPYLLCPGRCVLSLLALQAGQALRAGRKGRVCRGGSVQLL